MIREKSTTPTGAPEIAYILKGFGRTSETFITNEIHLLESLGLRLNIYSVKKLTAQKNHNVINRINTPVNYLPQTTPFEDANFLYWLLRNLPDFMPSQMKIFCLRPTAWLLTFLECVVMSFRFRKGFFALPRKVFLKEFLQAGYIAEQVLNTRTIRHLHAHFAHGSTTIAMFASRLSGLPFSFTAHAKDIYWQELNPGNLLATKMKRASFVATCTEANKNHLQSICSHGAPIHTIYHGLDTSLFSPLAQTSGNKDKGQYGLKSVPVILSVGRMVEKKGFIYLIEACRILKSRGYDFRCQIIGGEDKDTPRIRAKITESQLTETVTLHHAVTQEELTNSYQQSAIFALPCQIIENGDRDGIPNVLVEAMAMEMPVVATDISGIPELVEHRLNGLLVPQKDAAALAEAIAELLNQAGLRERLGLAAREKVRRLFDSTENTVTLKTLFTNCLNASEKLHTTKGAADASADRNEHLSQPI